jgi:UDP-N-acetylmuramyl pentapeptide synthase
MAEIGVKVVNPQFSCHDMAQLARRLRENHLAVVTDVDRQHLLPFGTPQQLRDYICEIIKTFRAREGGLIGHAEFRGAVPVENIRAVFQAWADFGG